jgi:NitT/TauT family transport system permease protein
VNRDGTLRRIASAVLPPVAFGLLFLAAWQLFVQALDIATYVLPAPSDIWSAAIDEHAAIYDAAVTSGVNALVGLVIGTVLGVLMAALATRLPPLGNAITPLVAALAALPIVALAPLLNDMYASTSSLPRRIVVAISAFVPIFMNVLRGLSRLAPVHAELMNSYAASAGAVLRTIRIPGALPHFFIGLRIASSLAVIAAIVTEYFGGLKNGLGSRITSAVGETDYASAWASVLGAVLLGLLFFVAALVLERLVLGRRAAPVT